MRVPYRWTIVGIGALMTCVALGAMFSLAIFLDPISATGWSRAGISSAMTLNFLVMGAGAFGWGALSDRFGTRIVVLDRRRAARARAGSREPSAVAAPLSVDLRHPRRPGREHVLRADDRADHSLVRHATQPRGVARLGRHGRRTDDDLAVRALADHHLRLAHGDVRDRHSCVGAADPCRDVRAPATGGRHVGTRQRASRRMATGFGRAALRSRQFIVLGLVFFLCCAAHSGPIFHMVSYAMACGIAPMAAVSIYSVEGLAGLGGRLLFGVPGDRYGAKRVLIVGLLVQALAIGSYPFVRELGEFYSWL